MFEEMDEKEYKISDISDEMNKEEDVGKKAKEEWDTVVDKVGRIGGEKPEELIEEDEKMMEEKKAETEEYEQ